MSIPVSVLIQTKNEELAIGECVRSVSQFDEVVVVDSNSSDRTKEIAESLGARVENFTWNGKYPKKKQWQIDHLALKNEWILFLDADERPTAELISEIREVLGGATRNCAFDVELLYWFGGRPLRHGHRVVKRSLLYRAHSSYPEIDDLDFPGMGELEGHYQPLVDGPVGRLSGRIEHQDPDAVETWIGRHNKYSTWEALVRSRLSAQTQIRAAKSRQGHIFDYLPLKPAIFFLYSYFGRLGFLDGRAGFDYAVGLAWYYWTIGLKSREALRNRTAVGSGDGRLT